MGNNVAKNFDQISLGKGSLSRQNKALIAPGTVALDKPTTVLVRTDHNRKSTLVFDLDTMTPVFVTTTKKRKGVTTSKTKDPKGRTLFLTITKASHKNKKLIYRAPQDTTDHSFLGECASETIKRTLSGGALDTLAGDHTEEDPSEDPDHSTSSLDSVGTLSPAFDPDVPCAAQIELDRSGATPVAFLSVVVWKGAGPEFLELYKAIKVPNVKAGILVTDLAKGRQEAVVVGKSGLDEQRMEPKIQVARGADLPSVVALVLSLLGEF